MFYNAFGFNHTSPPPLKRVVLLLHILKGKKLILLYRRFFLLLTLAKSVAEDVAVLAASLRNIQASKYRKMSFILASFLRLFISFFVPSFMQNHIVYKNLYGILSRSK